MHIKSYNCCKSIWFIGANLTETEVSVSINKKLKNHLSNFICPEKKLPELKVCTLLCFYQVAVETESACWLTLYFSNFMSARASGFGRMQTYTGLLLL